MITTIIAVLIIIGIVVGIGSALVALLAAIAPVLGGIFLILVAIGFVYKLIEKFGMTLLLIIFAIFAFIFAIVIICTIIGAICAIYDKIKLIFDTKKYVEWLDSVGVGENEKEPFRAEARERAILKGNALKLNSEYTASPHFYSVIETEMLRRPLFTITTFDSIVHQAKSGIKIPPMGSMAMMKYLAEKNSLPLFYPAMTAVQEYCCIQPALLQNLEETARGKGMMTQAEFESAVLSTESAVQVVRWLPLAFLELLVSEGEMVKFPLDDGRLLYKLKGYEALGSEATTTEIDWDD